MQALVQQLTIEVAIQLAEESEEMRKLLNEKESLKILQESLLEKSTWKRITPVDHRLEECSSLQELKKLYDDNFVTAELYFKRKDWMKVILSVGDYDTLKQIAGMHASGVIELTEEEIDDIKNNFTCYPLEIFKVLFRMFGDDDVAISILRYPNFRPRDKERRLVPFVRKIKNKKLVAREAFSTAPDVFSKLGGDIPREVVRKVNLEEFQNIEKSLFSVLPEEEARSEIKRFAEDVMIDVLKRKVPFRDRELAWQFLSSYVGGEDGTANDELIVRLKKLETPDNRLWMRSRLP